jgi:hypothetical protein
MVQLILWSFFGAVVFFFVVNGYYLLGDMKGQGEFPATPEEDDDDTTDSKRTPGE